MFSETSNVLFIKLVLIVIKDDWDNRAWSSFNNPESSPDISRRHQVERRGELNRVGE